MKLLAVPAILMLLCAPAAHPTARATTAALGRLQVETPAPATASSPCLMRTAQIDPNAIIRPSYSAYDDHGQHPPLLAKGTLAPDFVVHSPSGKPIRLSQLRGKIVLIDFWATWCPACQETLPDTQAVAHEFHNKNVVTLAINVWDTSSAFKGWLPQHKEDSALTFAIDPSSQGKDIASRLYRVWGIPSQYVIDRRGRISASFVEAEKSDLEHALHSAGAS